MQKWTTEIWILLVESFSYIVLDLSHVALSVRWHINFRVRIPDT